MTRGPDKFHLFTNTHSHPYNAWASENVQVSQIFVNQILFNVVWLLYCLKQPCCKTSCEVNSSPSINTNVHIQAFKVWEPHLFKCVCVCMSLGVCVCAFVRVCARWHSLWHIKGSMNANCFFLSTALL